MLHLQPPSRRVLQASMPSRLLYYLSLNDPQPEELVNGEDYLDAELPEALLKTNETPQRLSSTLFNFDVQIRALETLTKKGTMGSVLPPPSPLICNRSQRPEGRRKQVSPGHHL